MAPPTTLPIPSRCSRSSDHSPLSSPKQSIHQVDFFLGQDSQDSGNSMTCSDPSGGSNDVPNLINLDQTLTVIPKAKSLLEEYDPLLNSTSACSTTSQVFTHGSQKSVISTTSFDSLFSDTLSSITSVGFSSSPEAGLIQQTSPRQSVTTGASPRFSDNNHVFTHQTSMPSSSSSNAIPSPSAARQRPHSSRSTVDTPSAPSSRAITPRLSRQSASSPTGSVQSLPQYPTYSNEDQGWPFYSDSSNNSSLLDLSIFDDPVGDDVTFNFESFNPPSLLPP